MRRLITGMQISVDGKITGPDGYADWVDNWGDNYNLMPEIDAALLGGGMYPNHEAYWSAIEQGGPGAPAEVAWAQFAKEMPHYVLSRTLTSKKWERTRFLRSVEEVAALKEQPGKSIYLIGGANTVASLIDAGLVDELRLHVHPLIAGDGKPLFEANQRRHPLNLREVRQLGDGRLSLIYDIG